VYFGNNTFRSVIEVVILHLPPHVIATFTPIFGFFSNKTISEPGMPRSTNVAAHIMPAAQAHMIAIFIEAD